MTTVNILGMKPSSLLNIKTSMGFRVIIMPKMLFKKFVSKPIGISRKDIHIWNIDLIDNSNNMSSLYNLLSFDENKKANAYRFEKDRINYITVRGMLRKILSYYLLVEPNKINFLYTKYGKPYLDNQDNLKQLSFNITHCEDFALCILSINREVGIDIEKVRPLDDYENIAQEFFTTNEYLYLKSIPKYLRLKYFFRYWTLKEAFVKAIGRGLSYALNEFEVQLMPSGDQHLLDIKNDHSLTQQFVLYTLSNFTGYEAAFACEGPFDQITYWQYIS